MKTKFLIGFFSLVLLVGVCSLKPVQAATGDGYWSTKGSKLVDASGNQVRIAGINWSALEGGTLGTRYQKHMDGIKANGFNTLRLLIWTESLDPKNRQVMLENLDSVIAYAGKIGLKVFIDRHRLNYTDKTESPIWYSSKYPESRWIEDWKMLAKRYKGNPTVIGADLHNEPHGQACWACSDNATDWRGAAERAGNAILAVNPDWLVIVEGVDQNQNTWWGGDLRGAKQNPVRLGVPNKLVYQAHEYGSNLSNGVKPLGYFNATNFPANLFGVWDSVWGYLAKDNIAPVLVGEFGTGLRGEKEVQWFDTLISYINARGLSWTYFSWFNTNGTGTGLLQDDSPTPRDDILAKLKEIQQPLNLTPIANYGPGCKMTTWVAGPCGAKGNGCQSGTRKYTRSVTPGGCDMTRQCLVDASCTGVTPTPGVSPSVSSGPSPLVSPALPARKFNQADVTVWTQNLGRPAVPYDYAKGNFNSDKIVNGLDYGVIFQNYEN